MTYILGLTGGIASGKTTVSNMFKARGVPVICADEIVHTLYKKDAPLSAYDAIFALFGETVLDEEGELDRSKIGQVVAHQKEKLTLLEQILHPLVRKEVESQVVAHQNLKTPLIVLDIPLLFNGKHWVKMCSSIAVTLCDISIRKARAFERGHLTEEKWALITSKQLSDSAFKERADHPIWTNISKERTEEAVNKIVDDLERRFV